MISRDKLPSEDGYELWLRYAPVDDSRTLAAYRAALRQIVLPANSPTLRIAQDELVQALEKLLGVPVPLANSGIEDGTLLIGTSQSAPLIAELPLQYALSQVGR